MRAGTQIAKRKAAQRLDKLAWQELLFHAHHMLKYTEHGAMTAF